MKIIECPRDAMQGIELFIPTALKAKYINKLLKVGFDTIDFGSFVSPKAVPQMRDTVEVLEKLDKEQSSSKLLAIVANERGANEASGFSAIDYLGFPLSMSETFQQKNTNRSISQAFSTLEAIQDTCVRVGKKLVVYISMGFGNPYGDPYNSEEVTSFVEKLIDRQVGIISLSDTVGVAEPSLIAELFQRLLPAYPEIEFGAHLHSTSNYAVQKIEAAYNAGCRRFDGALKGFGGCPMAENELVGNIPTETIIEFLKDREELSGFSKRNFDEALSFVSQVFPG